MCVFFAFIIWFGWTQNKARKALRAQGNRVDALQVENLTNFDTVKFFSQEVVEEKKYHNESHGYREIERPYVNRYLLLQIGTTIIL